MNSDKEFQKKLVKNRQFLAKFFSNRFLSTNIIDAATKTQINVLSEYIHYICEKKIPIRPFAFDKLSSYQLELLGNFDIKGDLKSQLMALAPSFKYLLRPVFFKKYA